MQKLFIEREREKKKKELKTMDKCPRYQKQWVLKYPPEKKPDE